MKRHISFYSENISDLYLIKIQISFCSEKISDLYLMKIQICFYSEKNSRSVFNENTDLFLGFRSSRFSRVLYQ